MRFLGTISVSEATVTPRNRTLLSKRVSGISLSPPFMSPIKVEKTPLVTVTVFQVGVPQEPRMAYRQEPPEEALYTEIQMLRLPSGTGTPESSVMRAW